MQYNNREYGEKRDVLIKSPYNNDIGPSVPTPVDTFFRITAEGDSRITADVQDRITADSA